MFIRRHKKLIIFSIIFITVALSGLTGYLIADGEPRVVAEAEEDDTVVQAGTDDERIGSDTVLMWDYEYDMCRHHVLTETMPEKNMLGLTFTQLKEKYPNVVVASFSADEVMLKKRLECYCPQHFILKRNKEKLTVYHTAPGTDKQDVYIDVDINFESLPKEQRDLLEEGRVFADVEDLQGYLDKLNDSG